MSNDKLISVVMTLKDYEKWTRDEDSFIRINVFDEAGMVTYSMTTYEELWKECQYYLDDDTKIILEQLTGKAYEGMKLDLLSDFFMKNDAYSYADYIESDSFIPSITLNQIGFQYFYSLIFCDYRDDDRKE